MTSIQILNLIRSKILESTEDIITNDTLLIYMNFAYQDIIKRVFPNNQIKTTTITFTNGEGTLPTDFGTLYGDAYSTDKQFYPEMTIEDFNKELSTYGVVIENGKIKVLPNTVTSLNIKYYPVYTALSESDDPEIDEYFHEPIIYGSLARAFEDLQDEQLADRYNVRYENLLNQKIAVQSNYEEGNQRSGQMFNGIDMLGGGISDDPNYF